MKERVRQNMGCGSSDEVDVLRWIFREWHVGSGGSGGFIVLVLCWFEMCEILSPLSPSRDSEI